LTNIDGVEKTAVPQMAASLLFFMPQWFALAVLALKVSIPMQVFAIGLGSDWRDAVYLFRRPRLLARSILARNFIVPIVAVVLIKTFPFHVAVAITLGVLAVTPVPPLLPRSQIKGGRHSSYVLGLLVSQSLLAILLVPITIEFMDWALGARAHFSAVRVAALIGETILIPLAAGMLASRFVPKLRRFAPRILMVGTVLLIGGAIPLLFLGWKALSVLAGNGAILAIVIFVIAGTAAGHLLGGREAGNRIALAVATPARHPGLAVAIAQANYPEQSRLVAGAVVIYLILRVLLAFLYTWRHPAEKEA
jgi:bile acid:Na+ symporter, BASS family